MKTSPSACSNIYDRCVSALLLANVQSNKPASELKARLHEQFKIPNAILDEVLLASCEAHPTALVN